MSPKPIPTHHMNTSAHSVGSPSSLRRGVSSNFSARTSSVARAVLARSFSRITRSRACKAWSLQIEWIAGVYASVLYAHSYIRA